MEKLKMHSPDLTEGNISKLADLFPNCVTESKDENGKLKRAIDFDQLKQELSKSIVEGPQERYRLDWPGKREALLVANSPIAKTLRPCREESEEFGITKNLFIEGDNLEALKLIQETYLNKIKLIYIDPPYNTGSDLLYDDDFSENSHSYFQKSNQEDELGNRMTANTESNGRMHSDWLTMLYPRLKLARNLLTEDGAIIIHIDEHEHANLMNMVIEIFGETNVLGSAVWDKKNPKGDSTRLAYQHESVLIVAKNQIEFGTTTDGLMKQKKNAITILNKAKQVFNRIGKMDLPIDLKECARKYQLVDASIITHKRTVGIEQVNEEFGEWIRKQDFSGGETAYSKIDEAGNVYRLVSMAWPNKKTAPEEYFIPLKHPITEINCPVPGRGWRNPPETMRRLMESGEIVFGTDHNTQPQRKYLLKNNMLENLPSVIGYGGSDDALLSQLGIPFEHPKPVDFARELIGTVLKDGDIILDFFAGSGTTAHAVMLNNIQSKTNVRWILVQIAESISSENKEQKLALKFCEDLGKPLSIAELTKERLRRAGKKIKNDNSSDIGNSTLDFGFRVLKIDTSNMESVYYVPDSVKQESLLAQIENIRQGRTSEDLLFQVLLDWGVDLALPISLERVGGKEVYFVDGTALAACFESGIDEDFIKELAKRNPLRVVFRDSGFSDDSVKINVEQIFKLLSPDSEIRVI